MKTTIILIALLAIQLNLSAQRAPVIKKSCQANRTLQAAPVVDGVDDEQTWQNTSWNQDFVQYDPVQNVAPSQNTSFKVLYDNNNIYFLIRASDSIPTLIDKRLTNRDNVQGDWVAVQIDSYNDKQTSFCFWVNAAGVKQDAIMTNDGENMDDTWDALWTAKTSIDNQGWITEIKIPLSQLRFNADKEQVWGLQVVRFIHRKQEKSLWQFVPKDASGWVRHYGEVTGISGVEPKRQIELQPYIVGKYEHYEKEEGNPYKTGSDFKYNAGLDGKIGLTNDFTLDFTVNPDFGQVEADPSQVNLTAFESYFSEKRPFFIEGKNILSFGVTPGDNGSSSDNLFYSRRIGRAPHGEPENYDYVDMPQNSTILGAFKITGKTKNGLSLGMLESVTQKEMAKYMLEGKEYSEAVEPFTNYFVAGAQQDFQKGNTILGGMITATNRNLHNTNLQYLPKSAYTGGVNFTHNWKNRTYYFNAKFLVSQVNGTTDAISKLQTSSARYFNRPDNDYTTLDSSRTSLMGQGGILQFGKAGNGHWRFTSWLNWRSPSLETNDVGFLRKSDDIFQVVWVQYREWEPKGIFKSYSINMNQWSGWDFGLKNTYSGGNINLNLQFKNFWFLGFGTNVEGTDNSNFALRGGPALSLPGGYNQWMFVSSDQRKKFVYSFNAFNYIGFEKAQRIKDAGLGIEIRPNDAISISLNPSFNYSRNDNQYVTDVDYNNDKRYILASIDQKTLVMSVRLNYCLTPNLSVQYYGQPFISAGKYSKFKMVTNPSAQNYNDRFYTYPENQITYNSDNEEYNFDENNDGIQDYTVGKPDFKAMFFLSNLVIRWEYLPGSTLYLVWSQNKNQSESNGNFGLGKDIKNLYDVKPYNVFLIKLSYRFKY